MQSTIFGRKFKNWNKVSVFLYIFFFPGPFFQNFTHMAIIQEIFKIWIYTFKHGNTEKTTFGHNTESRYNSSWLCSSSFWCFDFWQELLNPPRQSTRLTMSIKFNSYTSVPPRFWSSVQTSEICKNFAKHFKIKIRPHLNGSHFRQSTKPAF